MNENIEKTLTEDFLKAYNQQLSEVYQVWSTKYNHDELRIKYLAFVQNHILDKTVEALHKKIANKKMLKEMSEKLNLIASEGYSSVDRDDAKE
jgi:hypothetical protein